MPTVDVQTLRRTAQQILEAVGTPSDSAQAVSESLVEANLAGHDSHGVIRLMQYVDAMRQGLVKPSARAIVAARHGATATVDGAWGWGQPAARLATRTAIELASEYGVGAVTLVNGYHIGRLGEYVTTIADAGMLGLAMCNAAPAVAPFGGSGRVLGTNPIAWAAPGGDGHAPLMLDIATSSVAEGKLRVARTRGETVAPGLVIDSEGRPSQNPDAFYNGGALLPFGGHKGYGLSVLVELVGRGLAGADGSYNPEQRGINGTLIMALNIASFAPMAQFMQAAERLSGQITSAPAAASSSGVLLPGDPERQMRERRMAEGVPLPEQTWEEIQELAESLGV
jgi:LDH2 family malate/lactate/ureidoglycolate dehydrogenase